MKTILLILLKTYKMAISPYIPRCCRFYPSCSDYAYESIQRHGFFYGIFLSARRLLRCQPFTRGGYDPVPRERLRQHPHIADERQSE